MVAAVERRSKRRAGPCPTSAALLALSLASCAEPPTAGASGTGPGAPPALVFAAAPELGDAAERWIAAGPLLAAATAEALGVRVTPGRTVTLVASLDGDQEGHAGAAGAAVAIDGPPWRVARTLAHELAHLAERDLGRSHEATPSPLDACFYEGAADWVAYEVLLAPGAATASPEERDALSDARSRGRTLTAAMIERRSIDLGLVFDGIALRARVPPAQAYALGELTTEGVSRACGAGAVARVLAAMSARPLASTGWDGMAPVLEAARCDPSAVDRAWRALVDDWLVAHRAEIDAIPRSTTRLERGEDGTTSLVLAFEPPLPPETRLLVQLGPPDDPREVGASVAPASGSASARIPLTEDVVASSAGGSDYLATLVVLGLPGDELGATEGWTLVERGSLPPPASLSPR